jgi:hypothetical protein
MNNSGSGQLDFEQCARKITSRMVLDDYRYC